MNKLLNQKVSFQENAWSPLGREYTIGEVLNFIKNGNYAADVTRLRTFLNKGNKEAYDSNKRRLPGVTFSATFNEERKRENLNFYNQVVVIDIDKVSPEKLDEIKDILSNDQFVSCFWESPSKTGIKGLVQIDSEVPLKDIDVDAFHKHAFKNIVEYFLNNYGIGLDISGSDTTRLCFLSHDPNIVLKGSCKPFPVKELILTGDSKKGKKDEVIKQPKKKIFEQKINKNILLNPKGKNSPSDRSKIQSIIKYLTKRNISITNDYNSWYRVALAISNTFTHDIGEKYFLRLCRLDGAKHDELQSKNLLLYCYEHSKKEIFFKTIVYLAKQAGYREGGAEGD